MAAGWWDSLQQRCWPTAAVQVVSTAVETTTQRTVKIGTTPVTTAVITTAATSVKNVQHKIAAVARSS